MRNIKPAKCKLKLSLRILPFLLLVPQLALAHATLVSSTPAVRGTVHGPDITVDIKFNSRIDGSRSRIVLVAADGNPQNLQIKQQTIPNGFSSHLQLKPGKYTLYWQALAVDGHITRGVIPFTVQ
jgi:copper resistance protein C